MIQPPFAIPLPSKRHKQRSLSAWQATAQLVPLVLSHISLTIGRPCSAVRLRLSGKPVDVRQSVRVTPAVWSAGWRQGRWDFLPLERGGCAVGHGHENFPGAGCSRAAFGQVRLRFAL